MAKASCKFSLVRTPKRAMIFSLDDWPELLGIATACADQSHAVSAVCRGERHVLLKDSNRNQDPAFDTANLADGQRHLMWVSWDDLQKPGITPRVRDVVQISASVCDDWNVDVITPWLESFSSDEARRTQLLPTKQLVSVVNLRVLSGQS